MTQPTLALGYRCSVAALLLATSLLGADRQGTPVVLTHGTPSWSYLWRHVAPALAAERPVYLWDLPTYGDSTGAPTGEVPTAAGHARTLAALVEHWGLTAPVLVGHDIGAAAVLRAHLIERTPAGALVLADAAVLSPWVTGGTQHVQDHLDTYRQMPTYLFDALVTTHLRTAVAGTLSDEAERAYADHFTGAEGQQRYLDHVSGFTEDDTRDVVARLGEITVPTDIIWGAEDTWLASATATTLRDAIPGARLHTIPGAGHFLTEDAPEAFLEILTAVLR